MALDQQIIDLYDEYTHKPLARRTFLERLTMVAGSSAAAASALLVLEPNYARAALVPETDPRIETQRSRRASTGSRSAATSPGPKARARARPLS